MRMVDLIAKKKEGQKLTAGEIEFIVRGYTNGEIADYQMSAMLMAIRFVGLDNEEAYNLTKEMARYGDTVDLSEIPGIKVDKHSTGGVGDKTTLIITPMAAACGAYVAKMSGRGLGDTGGTVDKLESIPGYRTKLKSDEFIAGVKKSGACLCGHSGTFAVADAKIYNLRNDTSTTDSIGLIASSIMSKKLASGADKILLDVKAGSGAFMKKLADARELARMCVEIGKLSQKEVRALITNMDVPLGNMVGNSLEVIEAVDTLKGQGPEDLRRICILLASHMLNMAGLGGLEQCGEMAEASLKNGTALAKFIEMAENSGADTEYIKNPSLFEKARITHHIKASESGYIERLSAGDIGRASFILGAGRAVKGASVDFCAGVEIKKKQGDFAERGETVCILHTNDEKAVCEAEAVIVRNIRISRREREKEPLVYEILV